MDANNRGAVAPLPKRIGLIVAGVAAALAALVLLMPAPSEEAKRKIAAEKAKVEQARIAAEKEQSARDHEAWAALSRERAAAAAKTRIRGREELELEVRGMYSKELLERLGPPARTQQSGSRAYWYYENRSVDRVTERVDAVAQISLEFDRVTRVSFY